MEAIHMEIKREGLVFKAISDEGNELGKIVFQETDDPQVLKGVSTHTAEEARGQGIAGKMLDHAVEELAKEDKKIIPVCSYIVSKFEKDPDKYGQVMVAE